MWDKNFSFLKKIKKSSFICSCQRNPSQIGVRSDKSKFLLLSAENFPVTATTRWTPVLVLQSPQSQENDTSTKDTFLTDVTFLLLGTPISGVNTLAEQVPQTVANHGQIWVIVSSAVNPSYKRPEGEHRGGDSPPSALFFIKHKVFGRKCWRTEINLGKLGQQKNLRRKK